MSGKRAAAAGGRRVRRGWLVATCGLTIVAVSGIGATAPAFAVNDLDPSFGGTGLVTQTGGDDQLAAVAIQKNTPAPTDDQIVAAGRTLNPENNYDFSVVRVNQNGTPDTAFDTDGRSTAGFSPQSQDFAQAVALAPDGKIVLAGVSDAGTDGVPRNVIAVARFNANGSRDNSFGTVGTVLTGVGLLSDRATAVVVQPDKKVVVAGQTFNGTDDDFAVVRYNENGSLDTTFDTDGILTVPFGLGNDRAYSILLRPDSSFIMSGSSLQGSNETFAAYAFSSTGAPLAGFGASGKFTLTQITTGAVAFASALIPGAAPADDRFVLAGSSSTLSDDDITIIKLRPDGQLDTTFTDPADALQPGILRPKVGPKTDVAQAVSIDPGGRIIVAGFTTGPTDRNVAVLRYSAAGVRDKTFSGSGTFVSGGANDDIAFGVAVQTDLKIVVAGVFDSGAGSSLSLQRLLGETVSVGDTSVAVSPTGTVNATVVLTLSNPSPLAITVAFSTADVTAVSGIEYTAQSGVATFAPNQTLTTVTVPILPSGEVKPDQTLKVGLGAVTNASVLDGEGIITLFNLKARKYWLTASDGGVFAFGTAGFFGSTGGIKLNQPIVGMASTPSGLGYWLVARDGGIFAFGDAKFFGSAGGIKLNQPIVGMAASPSGLGYWLVAADGGIFAYGDAVFRGSTGGIRLNQPIVGMAVPPNGAGYWLVARDGGIFAFGLPFAGSTGGLRLNQPIVAMAPNRNGAGYWLVAQDGGIFAFNAPFFGSTGAITLNQPVVGMAATSSSKGYWLVARDGGIFAYGDAVFEGSTGGIKLNQPIVGMAAR